MSTPGGYGGYGQDPNQQYDPLTGQPLQPGATAQYPGPDTSGYHGLGQYPQTSAYPANFPTGGFPQQPPPQPPKRTGLIAGVIAAVLVVAVGATLLIVFLNKDDNDPVAGPPSTTSAPPPTTTRQPITTTTTTTSGTPQYPGWQTVTAPAEHVQYDVPDDWQIEPASNSTLTIPNSQATMGAVATFRIGACPGRDDSFRAKVGVAPEASGSTETVAKSVAKTWADALAAAYKGTSASVKTSAQRVNHGRTDATLAVTRIKTEKSSCNPPSMLIAVVSFKSASGTESLVLFGDQDVPDAITSSEVAKVLTTARPTT